MKIGLALGSGSARGWAHIGVIRELEELGIVPDIVCGASIGSLVGAVYASGQLDVLEEWVRGLDRIDVLRLLDASLTGGGVIQGSRVIHAIANQLEDRDIESLPKAYAAVATDLYTGHEVWLREGPMLKAVRASSGLPGLFVPVHHDGRWLVDGGVVNPVPVSLCRVLGAERVLAVNLNRDLVRQGARLARAELELPTDEDADDDGDEAWPNLSRVSRWLGGLVGAFRSGKEPEPGLFDVIGCSINIMQDRITRSRMVGDPPDVVLSPRLGHFELMDFHRADEAIAAGRECVRRATRELEELFPASERRGE